MIGSRALVCLLCLLLLSGVFGICARAEQPTGISALPTEYQDMLEALPEALRESLPDELFTTDPQSASEALRSLTSVRGLLDLLLSTVKQGWQPYLSLLLQLLGILLLRAVWNAFSAGLTSPTLSHGLQLLFRLGMFGMIVSAAVTLLEGVQAFYTDLSTLTGAFLPLMGAMYAMGGNVGAAAANQGTLILTFSLVEWVGGQSVVPLFSLCLAFALLGVFETSVGARMQLLAGKLKKWYTTALTVIMLILSSALAAQTTLAARADSLAFRTARLAVSSGIPLVGGGVADMLRTAASGLSWLRALVGVSGVVLLLWLLLPQIVTLLMTRWTF